MKDKFERMTQMPRQGRIPVGGLEKPGADIKSAMTILFADREAEALMPTSVPDKDMKCGGREKLHLALVARRELASAREKIILPCGECAVRAQCPFVS